MDALDFDTDEMRRLEGLLESFGPTINEALNDPTVVEISVNDDGLLWVEHLGKPMMHKGHLTYHEAKIIIEMVADFLDEMVNKEHPVLDGELPDGSRFAGIMPPNVQAPSFSIRKHVAQLIPLQEYVDKGILPRPVYDVIKNAIVDKKNIFLIGGTGSGKTTLVNSIINEMSVLCPNDRLLIIEDTREIQSFSPNTLRMRSTVYAPMQLLVAAAMRLRPDRIIIGEVRKGEALDLLTAFNTGHPGGISTLHADSAAEGLDRLESMIGMASKTPMPKLIGNAVDLVIFIEKYRGTRRVGEALWCHGYNKQTQEYNLETIYEVAA